MEKTYYRLCKECEHNYHCYGREIAEKIKHEEVDNMYLSPDSCANFYPEREQ